MNSLWGINIPIIMVSGKVNDGKTLFALTIDPNCRKPKSEAKPTTLVYDQEGSADSYKDSLNFEHKDTRAAVAAGVHREVIAPADGDPRWVQILKQKADVNDSPAASMFRAWYLSLLDVEPRQYTVGVCDTFTPLQEGLIDWLRRHPEAFGRTANEYGKASSMFLWPDVKNMLAHILAVDCRLRFETFVINLHLKNEWSDGRKTGNKIAEGLDVLEKLATLHLELDRTPKEKGKEAPRVPAAILKKERLVKFGATPEEDQPILPPRLPVCSPDAIRKYIASPPDFAKLSVAERLPDSSLTDDQKLLIQQDVARNNAEAEAIKLSALDLARAAAARPEPTAKAHTAAAESTPAATQPQQPAGPTFATTGQQQEMMGLLKELFASGAEAQAWMAAKYGLNNPAGLTTADADGVLAELHKMKAAKTMPPEPSPGEPEPGNDGKVTQGQRDQIRDMTMKLYGDRGPDEQAAWLKTLGFSSAMSCSYPQAAARILELQRLANPAGAAATGDGSPF